MTDPNTLQQRFHVPGLTFDQTGGLTRLNVATPAATATIYLQGAHLTAWQPAGFNPAILLSQKSEFGPGKAIRGGIPIVFPWFAGDRKKDRIDGHPGPSHGFARIQEWSLDHANRAGDAMHLTFSLGPTDLSRSMGFDAFRLTLDFTIGTLLDLSLRVANTGSQPLNFEQAFHTYYRVADIHETAISGLEPTGFIDKTDDMKSKPAENAPIRFTQTVDRVYNGTTAPCVIQDVAGRRIIRLVKSGSHSTIVWNAFKELPDLGPWDWHEYVAVETGNVGADAITLAPGAQSSMGSRISLAHTR